MCIKIFKFQKRPQLLDVKIAFSLLRTHTHTLPQEMDDIVNTIHETWDCDVEARLSSQCVYERLVTFASKFESSTEERDSGFSTSEHDTTEVCWLCYSYSRVQ